MVRGFTPKPANLYGMKTCRKGLHQYEPSGNNPECPECKRTRQTAWAKNNPEKNKAYGYKWRKNNPDKAKANNANWQKANPDKINARNRAWVKANPGKRNARSALYRAMKIQATPSWLTEQQIKEIRSFYILAKELQWLSSNPLEVDHIVPLQGDNVCGLHVPWNLQILDRPLNISKSNHF